MSVEGMIRAERRVEVLKFNVGVLYEFFSQHWPKETEWIVEGRWFLWGTEEYGRQHFMGLKNGRRTLRIRGVG